MENLQQHIEALIFTAESPMSTGDIQDYLSKRLIPVTLNGTPAEFDAYVRSESQRWMKIIKDNNVRID